MIKKQPSLISIIYSLSRPRFWFYLAGPYLVGFAIVQTQFRDMLSLQFLYGLFFFLIPANIFLYGINDLSDGDTDAFNAKKTSREIKTTDANRSIYLNAVLISAALSAPLFIMMPLFASLLLLGFMALSAFYSAPPLRLKAKPFVDSASNILYAFPAFIAMYQFAGTTLPLPALAAIFAWTAAMHLFSAIPDISADAKAGLRTTAVVLGERRSLFTCAVLWTFTAIISVFYSLMFIFLFAYPTLCFWLLKERSAHIERVYWLFPYINTVVGFMLYLIAVMT